jgi:hypothetical protein
MFYTNFDTLWIFINMFENNNCDFFAVIENKRLGAPSYKMSIRED